MMPPSYYGYISYSIQAKIEDETLFGQAKYCDPIPMKFRLCKEVWTTSTVDGFQNIELEERP